MSSSLDIKGKNILIIVLRKQQTSRQPISYRRDLVSCKYLDKVYLY